MSRSCCLRIKVGDVIRIALDNNGYLAGRLSSPRNILMYQEYTVIDKVEDVPIIKWCGRNERIAFSYIFSIKKKCTPASES